MRIRLNPLEARVIGCLIEKEIVTPAQYPLSINALVDACNQKSSRDPVLKLSAEEVQEVVDGLLKRHLVSDRGGFGSRVTKYQHRFGNVGFGSTEFTDQELGILCVLLLRGPQTPGDLRARTNRLCQFGDAQETERVLDGLMRRKDGPFVARLAPEPGRREARYRHLFGDDEDPDQAVESTPPATEPAPLSPSTPPSRSERDRIAELEELVLEMQQRLDELATRVARLEGGG